MLGGQNRLKKLRWQSRRGMKELDVLLEAFVEKQADSLIAGDWPKLEEILSQEDDVLYGWISGRNLPSDPETLFLIKKITNVA